jgi:hypothetical protein
LLTWISAPVNGEEPQPVCSSRITWYTGPFTSRTSSDRLFIIRIGRPDLPARPAPKRVYRNPVIFARELAVELEQDRLTRQQLADRHAISLDRVIQWLALLKLPEEQLEEIAALGDYWDRRLVTERGMRLLRRAFGRRSPETLLTNAPTSDINRL